jgi:hypothetical protein
MNDICQRRSGGGADETFDGANAVAAALNEVLVSSSLNITPPMATAVIVIVIVPPSLADRHHRRPCPPPPPPARTPIPERKTCPRGAMTMTTTARSQSCTGHCRWLVKDNRHPPPPLLAPQQHQRRNLPHVSKSWGPQADAALVGLVVLSTMLAFPSGNNFPVSPLHFWRIWASAMAKGDCYRECRSQCEHSSNDRRR